MRLVDKQAFHDDWLLAGSGDEPEDPLTEAERASQWDDARFDRIDAEWRAILT